MSAPRQSWSHADLLEAAKGLLGSEQDLIANLANLSALLFEALPQVNWAGFYLLKNGELVLGPFQGRIACTRIPLGRGVCGTAAQTGVVQRVADVHEFPGHIACDSASESEIVLPLHARAKTGKAGCFGVLDIDSPIKNRFSAEDQACLEKLVDMLEESLAHAPA